MKKVLLVDDDVDFCEASKILLESKAYEVVLAHDGKEGLEKVRAEKPDLVILDVMMPEMNGYDVCVILKADPELNKIPVILLTAVDQMIFKTTYTKHMGLMTEADDYIAKPVESTELVKRVEEFLGKNS
ncbi:MAG: response regulator [Deltaproteobacteria bacterium]|nr:response regulator [Deltaproteobacteria bacterium]MBW2073356.1 response regulator [Deltaproteobacteria bacterium]RLB83215.1 MAG: response regulator [Deltaproteobacteria bacterium]